MGGRSGERVARTFNPIGPDGLLSAIVHFWGPLGGRMEWGSGWPELLIQSAQTGLLSAIVHFCDPLGGREGVG